MCVSESLCKIKIITEVGTAPLQGSGAPAGAPAPKKERRSSWRSFIVLDAYKKASAIHLL